MPTKKNKKAKTQPREGRTSKAVPKATYILHLFVAGATARSHQAVLGLNDLCNEKIKGRFKLIVFDIFQQPKLAKKHQIVATPTLIKVSPFRVQRFVGLQGILKGFTNELNIPETF